MAVRSPVKGGQNETLFSSLCFARKHSLSVESEHVSVT
jgi:hypothetical protein